MRTRRWRQLLCAGGLLLALAPGPAAAQWLDGWARRLPLDVAPTTSVDLLDFPLLVNVTGPFGEAPGGALAFTLGDGVTRLDAEVERFEPDGGVLVAWVRLPTLAASGPNRLYLYLGHPDADAGAGPSPWSADYAAVWHLGDDPLDARCADAGTAMLCDSSPHGRHATPVAALSSDVRPAQVGHGFAFDGGNRLTYPCDGGCPSFPYSISAWFRMTGSGGVIVAYEVGLRASIAITNGWLHATQNNDKLGVPLTKLPPGVWHQVVVVYRSTTDATIYADGVDATEPSPDWWNAAGNSIGARVYPNCCGPALYFAGELDEIRIQRGALSAEWVAAAYENQRAPRVTVGAMELTVRDAGVDAGTSADAGVSVDAGPVTDAGTSVDGGAAPDAGPAEADEPAPRHLQVGCGCSSGAAPGWTALLALGLLSRRWRGCSRGDAAKRAG